MRYLAALLPLMLAAPPAVALPPQGLIAGLSGDWNGDEFPDLVTLWAGEEGAALVLHHGSFMGLEPVLTLPDLAFAGGLAGQMPGLSLRSDTAFVLHQEQTAIGRTPWMQDLVIAWRPALGGWVVAGYTYVSYDRLDPDAGFSCDVNLLTGAFERARDGRKETGRDAPAPLALPDLTQDWRPAACDLM